MSNIFVDDLTPIKCWLCPTVPVIVPVAQYTQRSAAASSAVAHSSFSYMRKEAPVYPPGKENGHIIFSLWELSCTSSHFSISWTLEYLIKMIKVFSGNPRHDCGGAAPESLSNRRHDPLCCKNSSDSAWTPKLWVGGSVDRTSWSSTAHRFSIRLRSEDESTPECSWTFFAVWQGTLSCWKGRCH